MSHELILEFCQYLDQNRENSFVPANFLNQTLLVLFVNTLGKERLLCVNYQVLNVIIIKNRYSLPFILETLDCLSQIKISTKLDIMLRFYHLRIQNKNKKLTLFRTRFDFFEYLIMLLRHFKRFALFPNFINKDLREYLHDFLYYI